jgi:hypothetical protein
MLEYEPFVCRHSRTTASHAQVLDRRGPERTRMKTALESAQTLTGEALERLARHYRVLRQEGEGDVDLRARLISEIKSGTIPQ